MIKNLVVVGMTLGTTWAIRGQFGHEQGAAWAGAVGALAILLIANRQDWHSKVFKATLAAAIGWGLGGMMSYGVVVGYGKGTEFINVYYGFLMLFIIGGLYGFIGGGLFGLTLSDTEEKKVNWPQLVVGMVAGGVIAYFFLIMQWEWFMTPPRSELWAACLGMGLFLTWFLIQYRSHAALRVAVFAGLGGGFGFAFGNFLQVLGHMSEISFNFWNVMEYSLGFFGGLGMAYGTFTAEWSEGVPDQAKRSNLVPMLLVVLFIPYVVWDQSFTTQRLEKTLGRVVSGDLSLTVDIVQWVALLLIIAQGVFIYRQYYSQKTGVRVVFQLQEVRMFFFTHFAVYTLYSLLITGAFLALDRIEQYLYLVNYAFIAAILPGLSPAFHPREIHAAKWMRQFMLVLAFFALLALIASSIHGEMGGMQRRFDL